MANATSTEAVMTAEIINLRQAKKQRARSAKETEAAANRAQFGRTKAERLHTDATRELEARRIDAHKTGDKQSGEDDKC